jgi:large subunit ribosomal protein L1
MDGALSKELQRVLKKNLGFEFLLKHKVTGVTTSGKVSFGAAKLGDNAAAFFDSLKSQKPTSLKGNYVKTISVSTTMGPGIKVESNIN